MEKFVIAVYVDNQFGVLTRVTSMFTRRGFNIDSLTVGETETPAYSRITITMSGILELCRTGVVALERGAGSMLEKTPGAYEY